MKLLSSVKAAFSRVAGRFSNRVAPDDPGRRLVFWASRNAGVLVTHETAFQVSVVWACIDAISKALAAQPWNVYERLPNGDRDLRYNDPMMRLLNRRPNPEMTAIAFRQGLLIAAVAHGNGFAEIIRDGSNNPVALWPILPDRVQIVRDADGALSYLVDGTTPVPAYNMLHIAGPGITGFAGDDMIAKAAHSIALAIAAERFGESYFGNNTQIGGVLRTPGTLDDETYNRLKEEWEGRHQNPHKAFRPAILEGGLEWESTTTEAEKAQLIQTRQHQIEEICRWFGVPPHKVAHLLRSTFNNIEHQGLEFVRDALTPWARRCEQEVDYKLFSPRGRERFTLIDLEPLSQGDAKSRAEYYQIMRNIGVYSVNDILRMEGKNTIGAEGDIRIVNGAAIRLEDVGKNYLPDPAGDGQVEDGSDTGGDGSDASGGQEEGAVPTAFRTLFASLYDRIDQRRHHRLTKLRQRGDGVDAELSDFVADQDGFLGELLRRPCDALRRQSGDDHYAVALRLGRDVMRGNLDPNDAARALVDLCFSKRERAT